MTMAWFGCVERHDTFHPGRIKSYTHATYMHHIVADLDTAGYSFNLLIIWPHLDLTCLNEYNYYLLLHSLTDANVLRLLYLTRSTVNTLNLNPESSPM